MKEKDLIKKVLEEKVSDKEQIRYRATDSNIFVKHRGVNMKKRAILLSAMIIIVIMVSSFTVFTPPRVEGAAPQNVTAYKKLLSVIEDFNNSKNSFNANQIQIFGGMKKSAALPDAAPMAPQESAAQNNAGNDYSKTNVQTKGMDEGDIIKVDGSYIYKINSQGCVIIAVNDGNMTVASQINVDNYVPQELYIVGNKLVMIGGVYEQYIYSGSYNIEPMYDCMCYINYTKTDIRIYDITDRSNPVLDRKLTVDGNYYTSRLIEETNELLYMVNYYFSYGNEDKYIPQLEDSQINEGEKAAMPVENIYYYKDIAEFSYLIVGKISLDNPDKDSKMSAFLGLGGAIYVSEENVYVATYDYLSTYKTNAWGWISYDSECIESTRIVKISLSDLKQKASGRVEGTIKDRYSLDEYQGYLRIAATVNGKRYNAVYVLNPELSLAGKITDIAPGEVIYSVRFNKEKGSLVTFERTDPYYNLDLKDPNNPKISKGLKEDGVSYYLHYIKDTDYTIGVGRNTAEVVNPYGSFVQWKELKITLYDNSSGEAVNVVTIYLPAEDAGWECYSELFYNPKALLYNEERGLFAFTYQAWKYSRIGYYNYQSTMKEGLAVFKIDLEAENNQEKLVYKGSLSNISSEGQNTSDWNEYYDSYFTFINRGVQIGDYIYTVSDRIITSYNIDTLAIINRLDLYNLD